MRSLKILGWSLLAVVVLLIAGAVALLWLVDPNDYKDEIARAVKTQTGRNLALEGDLKLSVFPWLALELGHAELSNPEGFGAGPFVSVEAADIGVRLWPLLRGQLEVGRVRIEGLRLNLMADAEGRTNWEDLGGAEQTPPSDATQRPALSIAGLSVKDSSLDYRDARSGGRWRLSDLALETGRLHSGEPFDLDLSFTADRGDGTSAAALKLKAETALDLDAEQYTFKNLTLDGTLQPAADAEGKKRKELPVSLRVPMLQADLAQQTLAVAQFVFTVVGAELNGSLNGEKIVDEPKFAGRLTLKSVSPRELFKQLDEDVPKTRDAGVLKLLAFDTRFSATSKSVELGDLKLMLDDTSVTGRAGIEDFDTMALRFDLQVDQIDLDRYQEPEKQPDEDEKHEPFELPVDTLKDLNAQGTIAIGALTVSGMKLTAVKFNVDADGGLVRVNPSQAKLYGGSHRGAVAIDARGPVARLTLEEHLAGIDFAPLMQELFDSRRLSGRGNANAVLEARGNNSAALVKTLDGRLDFQVNDGALVGADLWYEIRRARALLKREAMPAQGSLGRTAFRTLKGSALIEKGVLNNRDLDIDMDYLKVAGAGTLDLASQAVDYRLKTSVYRVPAEGAGAEMQDLKATEIPVRISGTLADLKVRPDVEAQIKAQAREKVDEKKQELKEKLTDKLQKWLGGKQQ